MQAASMSSFEIVMFQIDIKNSDAHATGQSVLRIGRCVCCEVVGMTEIIWWGDYFEQCQ